MTEQDERAVECMCMCGVSLEQLYICFPGFQQDLLQQVHERVRREREDVGYSERIA